MGWGRQNGLESVCTLCYDKSNSPSAAEARTKADLIERGMEMGVAINAVVLAAAAGVFILMVCSWWLLYEKMGEKGWVSLIPFYGRLILFKRVWEGKIYFIFLALRVVTLILWGNMLVYWLNVRYLFSSPAVVGDAIIVGSLGLFLFAGIFALASLLAQMMLNWRMTKCFGHGVGHFLGMTLFPILFLPILAYGRSNYDYY